MYFVSVSARHDNWRHLPSITMVLVVGSRLVGWSMWVNLWRRQRTALQGRGRRVGDNVLRFFSDFKATTRPAWLSDQPHVVEGSRRLPSRPRLSASVHRRWAAFLAADWRRRSLWYGDPWRRRFHDIAAGTGNSRPRWDWRFLVYTPGGARSPGDRDENWRRRCNRSFYSFTTSAVDYWCEAEQSAFWSWRWPSSCIEFQVADFLGDEPLELTRQIWDTSLADQSRQDVKSRHVQTSTDNSSSPRQTSPFKLLSFVQHWPKNWPNRPLLTVSVVIFIIILV